MGKPISNAQIRDARAPWWGCYAGRVIGNEPMSEAERADLWAAICHMRRVIVAYDAARGAPRRHAICIRLLAPVDALEASAETAPIDTRTDKERETAAVSALMQVEHWLGHTDGRAAAEAKRTVWDDQCCVDPEGLLVALRCVDDGIKGRRMKYRAR